MNSRNLHFFFFFGYEINFNCFSPYDYVDENEALKNAIEWLKEEASEFQEQLKEVSE